MSDIEEARKLWITEKQSFDLFAGLIASRVKAAVHAQGIWCETSGRAKEVYSLVKKLLKRKHLYDTLPDKAGARCVVRYRTDLERVVSIAQELFSCSEPDDKLKERQDNQVGYISIQLEARLRNDDSDASNYPPDKFWAE